MPWHHEWDDYGHVDPVVKRFVDGVIARTLANAKAGRPLDEGKNPWATCRAFGVHYNTWVRVGSVDVRREDW